MDFKVGVSLWGQASQDDRQHQPMDTGGGANFRDKLALDKEPQPSPKDIERPSISQPLSSVFQLRTATYSVGIEAYQRLDAQASPIARTDSVHAHGDTQTVELYALGSLAGHHLSQLPDVFIQAASAINTSGPRVLTASAVVVETPAKAAAPLTAVSDAASLLPTVTSRPQQAREIPGVSDPAQQLESYLATQWPDRRYQVVRRGQDEVELLVRDYHLDSKEQDALVADLCRHMSSMPKQPVQIWLNGRSVWQKSNKSNKE
jgi:hypothetical protein